MAQQVVTANRLSDGVVVYLTADGGWTERLSEGCAVDSDADAALMGDGDRGTEEPALASRVLVRVEGLGGLNM